MSPIELIIWVLAWVLAIIIALGGGFVMVAMLRVGYEVARYGEVRSRKGKL